MKNVFKKIFKVFIFLYSLLLFFQVAVFFGANGTSLLGFPYYPFNLFMTCSDGESMEPTIANETILAINPFEKEPEINKIFNIEVPVYDCVADTTVSNDIDAYAKEHLNDDGYIANELKECPIRKIKIVKRIKKINSDNCIWFEGDNKERSYDSREAGWFCPGEFEIKGSVMFKN